MIQKESKSLESDMEKLQNRITSMENSLKQHDKENEALIEKTDNLNSYLLEMRQKLIESLQDVKLPNMSEPLIDENFEKYLSNLRSLCVENCGPENKVLFTAVKEAVAHIQIS